MAPTNNLENRVTVLEDQMRDVTQEVAVAKKDAEDARTLACAADRDVAEFRGELRDFRKATIASFNATREDITDLRTEMRAEFADVRAEMRGGFAKVDENFAKVDDNFTEMRGKLDGCAAGYQHITKLLNTIIEQRGE